MTAPRDEFEAALWDATKYPPGDASAEIRIAKDKLRALHAAAIERAEKAEALAAGIEQIATGAARAEIMLYDKSGIGIHAMIVLPSEVESVDALRAEVAALKAERDQNTDVLKLADEILHGGYAKVLAERDEWKQRAETYNEQAASTIKLLTAERDAARAELAAVRELLRDVLRMFDAEDYMDGLTSLKPAIRQALTAHAPEEPKP